jgi:hypothetical protein
VNIDARFDQLEGQIDALSHCRLHLETESQFIQETLKRLD